jgi:hypothetical protein
VNVLEDRPDKTFEKSFTFEAGVEDGERFTIPIRVIKAKTPGSEARSAG